MSAHTTTSPMRQRGRLGDRTALPRIGLPPSGQTAASRRLATQTRLRTTQALGTYTTTPKATCNHGHILDVGAEVEREIDIQKKRAQERAIEHALDQERVANAEKLSQILAEKEQETLNRLAKQKQHLEEQHAQILARSLIQREEEEKVTISKTVEQWKSFRHLAVEAEKSRSAQEYAKEKHLFGVELSNKIRKELRAEQDAAVTAAREQARADHAKDIRLRLAAQHTKNLADMQSLTAMHKAEIATLERRLQQTEQQLADQVALAETSVAERAAAELERDQIKDDYRRTLALKLPNYAADHSWLI